MFISWGKQKYEVKGRHNYAIRIVRIFTVQLRSLERLHKLKCGEYSVAVTYWKMGNTHKRLVGKAEGKST